ncbi:MAG: dihydroorotase [Bacteroidota bacterium]
MSILIKSVKVVDKGSPYDGQVVDIFTKQGTIINIGESLEVEADEIVNIPNLCVSVGWCDLRVHGRNPGFEQKENFESLTKAAVNGGFTDIVLLPNTQPIIQSKEAISFIKGASESSRINFWPLAAATHNCEGKDINELLDLNSAGAIGFSDGEKAVSSPDSLLKILQYLGQFKGLFMNRPEETKLNVFGQINEGLVSNLLGLKGLPAVSEHLAIQRDLNLMDYLGENGTNVRYHFSTISTAKSVQLIREAKQNGKKITCDIAAHQLIFTESDLQTFDPNFKVMPPFRSAEDIEALWAGLADGTIDAIVSDHCPHDPESKNLEFDLAEFGIIGLETLFSSINKINTKLRYPQLIEKLSYHPRKILGLASITIRVNEPAHFTLFETGLKWIFEEKDIQSKSKNTPFIGKNMLGKVHGVVVNGKLTYAE